MTFRRNQITVSPAIVVNHHNKRVTKRLSDDDKKKIEDELSLGLSLNPADAARREVLATSLRITIRQLQVLISRVSLGTEM